MSKQNRASSLDSLRNIGIIAHIDAGKTTLSERILFYTEKIHRMGEVHEGTATMDYLPEEQERGITIASACTSCQWGAHTINIIDTPGHVDFTIEVERSLRVLDGAVGVFCAVGGVEPQSETVWRQSENFAVPKIAFINKVDRAGADFAMALKAMREQLHIRPVLLTMPLGQGEDFCAILDIVHEQRLQFSEKDQGASIERLPLTPEEVLLMAPWREALLEKAAELDEDLLEKYMEAQPFSPEEIYAALRKGTIAREITPVLCGSALRNAGIQHVLDAICLLLPGPLDVPPPKAFDVRESKAEVKECSVIAEGEDPLAAPLSALIFKVLMDGGRKLAFMRLYAGSISEGQSIYNVNEDAEDRVQRIYRLHADHREQLESAQAGDIVAIVGLRSAQTGSTYASRKSPLQLEAIQSYMPVMTLALEPRNADESSTLDEALTRYTIEDPTLHVHTDEGSGHRMLSGMGELHLDVILERLRREYTISPRAGQPHVVCRETIATKATAEGIFDRELGKEHHFGKVLVEVSPLPRGHVDTAISGANNLVLGEAFPPNIRHNKQEAAKLGLHTDWIESALQGIEDTLQSGPLSGYPMQDVQVCLVQLEKKEGLSSAPGYHMAAGIALREALAAAKPLVLEPIMQVDISVPEAHLGAAISLFGTCGGRVENILDKGQAGSGMKLMQGLAPLSKLFGFSTSLRSATQGRAGLMMQFSCYDTV